MEADEEFIRTDAVHVHRAVHRHILDAADALDGEPILRHLARFIRRDPRIVGLIVGPAAHHQLQIRAVVVRQHLIPHMRFREVAPEEEFLTHRDMTV